MHACLKQAGTEILSLLLSCGADPTLEDHAGLSALIYAVNSGNTDVLRVLLDACKAKGKEVIIITTNKLPSGHQMTKQYLSVPPPSELGGDLHSSPTSCSMSPNEIQLQTPPRGFSSSASSQPGSPPLGLGDPQFLGSEHGHVSPQPASPIQHPSPLPVPGVNKRLYLQRLHSKQWSKSLLLLQQSQASSLSAEPVQTMPEKLSFKINNLTFHRKPPAVSRHYSIDIKDTTGLLKALENMSGNENRGGGGSRGFGRKMSYDSTASLYSASHPDLHQDSLPFPNPESCPVDEDSSDCLRQLNISSLENIVHRRNIGMDHYSSDSQLPHFGDQDICSKDAGGPGSEPERRYIVNSRSSTLSESKESLDSSVQRQGTAGLERRGSGALLLDHIAHTRPGYLPPLNPHAPIPDIGVSSSSSFPLGGNSKTLNSFLTGSKPILPCAPDFQRDLKAEKMLWRRHSMQSEQIAQLVNFKETFGH